MPCLDQECITLNRVRFLLFVLFFISGLAHASEFSAKVIAVMDGDTLLIMRDGYKQKVRLADVDAPEKAQPYGLASRISLTEMVKGKQIQVLSLAVDDYGRMVAMVSVDGQNVNHEQVRRGMAWEYSRSRNNHELKALQREAQQLKRGLWAGTETVEPAQWRKQHPSNMAGDIARHAATPEPGCSNKKRCSALSSCAEARLYFSRCGGKALDGDGDGLPCEKLCGS